MRYCDIPPAWVAGECHSEGMIHRAGAAVKALSESPDSGSAGTVEETGQGVTFQAGHEAPQRATRRVDARKPACPALNTPRNRARIGPQGTEYWR